MGIGDRKVLTLSHRAQVKRFTADALKVLKVQPGKQLSTEEFPKAYGEVLRLMIHVCYIAIYVILQMGMN